MGYIYGTCARKLYYINQYKEVGFTPQEIRAMQLGREKHIEIQLYMKEKYPDMKFESEYRQIRTIPEIFGIHQVGAKLDLFSPLIPETIPEQSLGIEIKYMYSKKAYYQIAIEKFVFPNTRFRVFQYLNFESQFPDLQKDTMISVKADLEMATVYVARIITALNFKPPRFPDAKFAHPTCRNCIYRQRCYSETDLITWGQFRNASQYAISRLSKTPIPNLPPQ